MKITVFYAGCGEYFRSSLLMNVNLFVLLPIVLSNTRKVLTNTALSMILEYFLGNYVKLISVSQRYFPSMK
jgi:hypothetical protein